MTDVELIVGTLRLVRAHDGLAAAIKLAEVMFDHQPRARPGARDAPPRRRAKRVAADAVKNGFVKIVEEFRALSSCSWPIAASLFDERDVRAYSV
jgi:hypothetical protein